MLRAGKGIAMLWCGLLAVAGCERGPEVGSAGFYGLAQEQGVWWFVDPDGRKMVSVGMNHIEPILISSDANKHLFAEKYGQDLLGADLHNVNDSTAAAKWVDDSIDLVKEWGFNTLGVHNPVPQQRMPYVAKFRPVPIDGWAKYERRYPDPFDPRTERFLTAKAEEWCAVNAEDQLIIGVSFNDMTLWRSGPIVLHPWVRATMELGEGAPGKQQWIEVLRAHYGDPELAAEAYGVIDGSWGEIEARTDWPRPARPWLAYQDVNAMLPLIADAWYGAETRALRSCDKNHLIFGDKFEGTFDLPTWLFPIIGRHFDLAYIQWYARADRQENKLAEIHAATGEPVLMGDSSFSHPNENLRRPKGVRVSSQQAVGDAYAGYLEQMMTTPYVVGWHHCGFIEGSPDLARYHPYVAIQSGFLRPDGTPYKGTVAKVSRANRKARDWHLGAAEAEPKGSWAYRPAGKKKDGRCAAVKRPRFSMFQVDNNVFMVGRMAIGTGSVPNKNIGWIVTDEGVVVIDTGFERSAVFAKQVMRQLTDKPVRYIIYSHHHGTQVAGAAMLREEGTEIIAHENLVQEFDLARDFNRFNRRRDSIQFNLPTFGDPSPPSPIYPDITFSSEYRFELGGTRFELYHVEGESSDYTLVFMPEQKIAWVADFASGAMPLVASPMKRVRDEVRWRKGLELIKRLDPDVMIASVGPPNCKKKLIGAVLDSGIEYLTFLHDAVAKEMNKGSSLEQTVANTRLPPHLRGHPLLREVYGCHRYNVAGLYHRYSGWFDQNGTHLLPAPRAERARSFVKAMGGRSAVLQRADELLASDELALSLEHVDLLIEADGADAAALRLKSELLLRLSVLHRGHHMTSNMYQKLGTIEAARALADPEPDAGDGAGR